MRALQQPDLFRSAAVARQEAAARGLDVEETVLERDIRLVGVIGGLVAGLNHALEEAAQAGIDVTIVANYQDRLPPERKRCVVTGRMRRIAFDIST